MTRVERHGLQVESAFADFIEKSALPGTNVLVGQFWQGLSELVHTLGPENARLLEKREELQRLIDEWHIVRKGQPHNASEYEAMLREIGYIVPEQGKFTIETQGIDPEIASVAAPQLVVPVDNARFAINAANARWNSLYSAIYYTDALGLRPMNPALYDPKRGKLTVAWINSFLDQHFGLVRGSHEQAIAYYIKDKDLMVQLDGGHHVELRKREKFVGYVGETKQPKSVLLRNNGLHVELQIDRQHLIGAKHPAGVADVILEAAVTTIMDLEDSVAVVDAEDKIAAYGNWLGLMKGDLAAEFEKDEKTVTRRLNPDMEFLAPDGSSYKLDGLALQLVRNVGLFLTSSVVLDRNGNAIFEGLLDDMCTAMIALHDVRGERRNSPSGSIYVVKPKLHGPEEVAFVNRVFDRVEHWLGLPPRTVKIGIMDEERRTTVNLKECIRAAIGRVAFINTGFLDRTGDEIHTSMEAGVFLPKAELKSGDWMAAYEDWNTEAGIACGLAGAGQIGKGMWAKPDLMKDLWEQKVEHPNAGASTAWVPSPTAAVLHALHYHEVNVAERQKEIQESGRRTELSRILAIPLISDRELSDEDIMQELESNLHGLIAYVVRWVDQGIGCSKVPDSTDVGLMEDRATCRISSQHIANWLHHGMVNLETVAHAMRRMGSKVDEQNRGNSKHKNTIRHALDPAVSAARKLVQEGRNQPSGYIEKVLFSARTEIKDSGC